MIIYNPHNQGIMQKRITEAEAILSRIPAKHCFITGSFLYKEKYKDIDVFVITRKKKPIKFENKKIRIATIDFNDLYSLFYHSVSKSCISKSLLPTKPLKVTISDYWDVVNEAIPTLLNQKNRFSKEVRFLILYTEYFRTGNILDSFQLNAKIQDFKNYKEVLRYITNEIPGIIRSKISKFYLKRFFYTQAGHYRDLTEYKAQSFLYNLSHLITRSASNG